MKIEKQIEWKMLLKRIQEELRVNIRKIHPLGRKIQNADLKTKVYARQRRVDVGTFIQKIPVPPSVPQVYASMEDFA